MFSYLMCVYIGVKLIINIQGFGGPSEKKCQSSLQPAWITPNPRGFADNRGVEID
jgi:hypothetical protein